MRKSDTSIYLFLFLLLLLVNAVLRLFDAGTFSLSNDELSAIARLNFDSFESLISEGVVLTDPHPAGAQILLYYWTAVFGKSVWAIRFPFIISGILGLVFMFLTFRKWFGQQAALLSTALFSLTSFSIIQGQLARPYAVGLFFVMLFTWAWTHVLFDAHKKKIHLVLFVLSGSLAAYTHYYAALIVAIICIGGLFAAFQAKILKQYLLLGVLMLLLFLPHIEVTIAQLSRGSITSWIPLAEGLFVFNHISVLLNGSIVLFSIATIALILLLIQVFKRGGNKFQVYALSFFLTPIGFGYIYSYYVGSALMDRVLYFSAPFFFGLIFSALPTLNRIWFLVVFFMLCTLTLGSTIFEEKLFERSYVEHFKELALEIEKRRTEKASDHLIVGNFNSSDYINFYLDPDQEFEIASLNSDNELAQFMKAARSFKGSDISIFWACNHHPFAANEYARRFFPTLSSQAIYFNSAFWNYNKQNVQRDTLINIRMGADSIGSEIEYISLLKAASSDVQIGEFINVHLRFTGMDVSGVLLVFALSDSSGNLLDWQGNKFADFVLEEDENEVFSSYQLRQPTTEAAVLSIYIWNSERRNLLLNSVEIQSFKDSDYRFLY